MLAVASFAAPAATDLSNLSELPLDTAIEIALDANPSLATAAARVSQAQAQLRQASSRYWPSLSGNGSAMQIDAADASYRPELGIEDPETYYRAELSATYVLFDGFARRFSVAMARHGTEESEATLAEARRQIVLAVTQTYLAAQLARENIAIGEEDVAFNSRLLRDTRARREVGGASLSDELNFEVRANGARATLIDAQREQAATRLALAALMGIPSVALPDGLPLAALDTRGETVVPDTTNLVSQALILRPDLIRARAGLARANASRGATRGTYSPVIALSAGMNGERTEDPGFSSDDFGVTAGLTVSYTFFDGGNRRAALQETDALIQQAHGQLRETELTVRREVQDAIISLNAARAQEALQVRNTELVNRNRDLVEKEYAAGQNSLTRLNEAQRDLVAAQAALAHARVAVKMASAELDAATARTVDQ